MSTVYLHGAGLNAASWGDVPGLCLDLPGHGAAPRAVAPTVEAFADTVIPALPKRVALVGHSLGGMVAMTIAARLPERVRSLVLVDAPLRVPFGFVRALAPRLAPLFARWPGPRGIGWIVSTRVERRAARPVFRRHVADMSVAGLSDAMVAAGTFDGRGLRARLTMPVLALIGVRSILTRGAYRAELRRAVPHVETRVMEAGHMIPMDLPEVTQAEITAFLERHP